MDIEPDFRPYRATDDGARLVLVRRTTVGSVLLRGCMFMLLLVVLAMFVLIPVAAFHRGFGVGLAKSIIGCAVLLPLNYVLLLLVLWGFTQEGVLRLEAGADGASVVRRGVFRERHDRVHRIDALEARTISTPTEYRDVRWLKLYARTGDERTDLGYLGLPPEPDPARDAAAHAAAGRIAERLRVPLELYGVRGERLA